MKKILVLIFVLLSLLGGISGESYGQTSEAYPVRPINLIVAAEAGSDSDVNGRPLCDRAQAMLGQPIMFVFKPGGGQTIGYREVYQAKPDGYTLGFGTLTLVTQKLQGIFPYDHRDFTLMGSFNAHYPMIVASTKTKRPFTTIQEVFAFAKSHPGELLMATGSKGTTYWIASMLLEDSGLKFNIIPQAGVGAFIGAQVGGGHVDIGITGAPSAKALIDSGVVRPLAIIGDSRNPQFPNVPTLKEVGYDISTKSFIGTIGPPRMPKNITDKLVKVFEVAGNDPEYRKLLVSHYEIPSYMSPEQVFNFYEESKKIYTTLFAKAGILKKN